MLFIFFNIVLCLEIA
uniref:Uncharacterized protein n=1 Tax=Arundo donax TaxID=35708 RepID=A0A0A8Y5N0_ARUDO